MQNIEKEKMLVYSAFHFYYPEYARRQITRESFCIPRFQHKLKSKKWKNMCTRNEQFAAMTLYLFHLVYRKGNQE